MTCLKLLTRRLFTQLLRRITSRMHSTDTISDLVLPVKKKTICLRESTTTHFTAHLHFLLLLRLSLAITAPFLLSHLTCQNTITPPPATCLTQIMNTTSAGAVTKPLAITTLALTKMMMTGNRLWPILMTSSSSKLHQLPTLRQNLTALLLHELIQESLRGTNLSP